MFHCIFIQGLPHFYEEKKKKEENSGNISSAFDCTPFKLQIRLKQAKVQIFFHAFSVFCFFFFGYIGSNLCARFVAFVPQAASQYCIDPLGFTEYRPRNFYPKN